MTAEKVEPGSLVRLKSGGPVMTVRSVLSDGDVNCCWFVDGVATTFTFGQAMLDIATPVQRPIPGSGRESPF